MYLAADVPVPRLCHARVPRPDPRALLPEILGALWRGWHPDAVEQLQLPLEMSAAYRRKGGANIAGFSSPVRGSRASTDSATVSDPQASRRSGRKRFCSIAAWPRGIVPCSRVSQFPALSPDWRTPLKTRDLLAEPDINTIEGKRDRAILAVLWAALCAGAKPEGCSKELDEFACGLLGAFAEVQAVIPSMNIHPAKLLGLMLTHRVRSI